MKALYYPLKIQSHRVEKLLSKITEVKIYPYDVGDSHSKVKAYAVVTLEGCLVPKGIKSFRVKKEVCL